MGSSVTGISLFASQWGLRDCMVTADRRQLEIRASGILCRAAGDSARRSRPSGSSVVILGSGCRRISGFESRHEHVSSGAV